EAASAEITLVVLDIGDVDLLDDFELGLLATAMTGLLFPARLLRLVADALFRRIAKEKLVAACELILQIVDDLKKLKLLGLAVFQLENTTFQFGDRLHQFLDFGFEDLRGAAKRLDIFYVVQGHGE